MAYESAVKCLYYPHIHFSSPGFVKASLLYWEGIKRIVPYRGYQTEDANEIKQLCAEGLVDDVPADEYRGSAADRFMPLLQSLLDKRGGSFAGAPRRLAKQASTGDRESYVHVWKMDERLVDLLQQSGLARQAGDWYAMEEETAGLYMITLCGEAATRLNSPMVTDALPQEVGSLYFNLDHGGLSHHGGLTLARTVSPFPAAEALENVSMAEFLKFRKTHGDERRRFRSELQGLGDVLQRLPSSEAALDLVNDRRSSIQSALTDLRRSLDTSKLTTAWKYMCFSVPTAVTTVAGWAGACGPIAIAGGVILGLVA